MSPTYTLQITFDRAKNLPVADIRTLSCDPYVVASLIVPDVEEPLKFRTPTVHRTRDPTWDSTWLVCGVPASGFKLLMKLYDEDPNAKLSVDRLGKAEAHFGPDEMKEGYESLEKEYELQKRRGDLHPYILTYFSALLPGQKLRKHNRVIVSVRVIRKDRGNDEGRLFTLGPNNYSRHFSPLIGSMVNKRLNKDALDVEVQKDGKGRILSNTTFIANKLQLTGPVPRELRHRYVGYRPFIEWMFHDSGIAGRILYYSLHRQHRSIYKCDKATVWGVIDDTGVNIDAPVKEKDLETPPKRSNSLWEPTPESSAALARAILDMTAWGEGGKLFTYVITLDGEWRFTETGPEFAIDLLSKHSMHADLAKEIAYSGEFFVQRLQGASQGGDSHEMAVNGDAAHGNATTNGDAATNGDSATNGDVTTTPNTSARDPKHYELVIDNNSGTYRPKKELLPLFERWLSDPRRLGGLGRVRAMDGFDEELKKAKEERKKEKAALTARRGKGKSPQ